MRATAAIALALALALTGCDELTEDIHDAVSNKEADFAEDAVEAVDLTRLEVALVAAVVDGIPLANEDTVEMATAAQAAAATTFSPTDCVQAVATESTVTYTFTDCTAPRGLDGLSGVATATFSVPASESVTVALTASDLGTGDSTSTINTTGTYSTANDEVLLALTTSGAGVTPSGDMLGRLGGYTATFDADCIELSGQWTTTVNDQTFWTTAVEGYHVCAGECPDGGTIGHGSIDSPDEVSDPLDGSGLVITLEGGTAAPFVNSEGVPGVLTLECP